MANHLQRSFANSKHLRSAVQGIWRMVVPGPLRDLLYGLREPLRKRKLAARLARVRSMEGSCKGKRLFCVGNGPSIASQNLALLAGHDTIVTNSFYLHPDLPVIRPRYYLSIEPPHRIPTIHQYMGDIEEALLQAGLKTCLLLPTFYRDYMGDHSLFRTLDVCEFYISSRQRVGQDPHRPISLADGIPPVQNVIQTCIMVGICLGYERIVLLGCDHDWLATPGFNNHFYQIDRNLGPEYIQPGIRDLRIKSLYEQLMESMLELWRSYRWLRTLAELRGTTIVNATAGGFLDVFERVDYEEELKADMHRPSLT